MATLLKVMDHAVIMEQIKRFIPPLNLSLHKGQCGKIGVLGGSFEYTGAPFYAAVSSLKVGADLSHIFCDEAAATAIKSYSPEIIVHPVLKGQVAVKQNTLDQQSELKNIVEKVTTWFKSLHVLVVGPGLGRDPFVVECAKEIIKHAREEKLPLVIDGDGLNVITKFPQLIHGYELAILTPNVAEYGRLLEAFNMDPKKDEDSPGTLARKLGNVTVLQKGATDKISNGTSFIECKEEGGPRRNGGQGDVLSGSIATFFAWANNWHSKNTDSKLQVPYPMLAAYGACLVVKQCNRAAFDKHYRSTTTPDMITEIGSVFEKLFPSGYANKNKL